MYCDIAIQLLLVATATSYCKEFLTKLWLNLPFVNGFADIQEIEILMNMNKIYILSQVSVGLAQALMAIHLCSLPKINKNKLY